MSQTLIEAGDLVIIVAFIVAALVLVIYVWRAERHHIDHRPR